MSWSKRAAGILVASLSVAPPASWAAERCDWLAGGLHDSRIGLPQAARAKAYSQWFCDQDFRNAAAAREFGGPGRRAKWFAGLAGYLASDDSKWAETYSNFCAAYARKDNLEREIARYERRIARKLEASLEACAAAPGVHAWIERSSDPALFAYRTIFAPETGDRNAAAIKVKATNANCELPTKTDASGTRTICRRDPNEPTVMALDSGKPVVDGAVASLPGRPPPAPEGLTSISGSVGSASIPSDFPDDLMTWGASILFNYFPNNPEEIMICTSGEHYNWDRANCGEQGLASVPYQISTDGDGNATIGIGVSYPYLTILEVVEPRPMYMGSGDSSCDVFANNGKQGQPPTQWWEYEIEDASGSAYTFQADVNVTLYQSDYYAQLTNCSLSSSQ